MYSYTYFIMEVAMKKLSKLEIIISSLVLIVVVALATIVGILKIENVIKADVNAFLLMLTVLTGGAGLYVTIFGVLRKGGYELAVGLLLFVIGIILLLVTLKVKAVIVIIVTVALILIVTFIMIISKAGSLQVERTDEDPNFKSFNEKLQEQKQLEKETEEELPKIKSFKD